LKDGVPLHKTAVYPAHDIPDLRAIEVMQGLEQAHQAITNHTEGEVKDISSATEFAGEILMKQP